MCRFLLDAPKRHRRLHRRGFKLLESGRLPKVNLRATFDCLATKVTLDLRLRLPLYGLPCLYLIDGLGLELLLLPKQCLHLLLESVDHLEHRHFVLLGGFGIVGVELAGGRERVEKVFDVLEEELLVDGDVERVLLHYLGLDELLGRELRSVDEVVDLFH